MEVPSMKPSWNCSIHTWFWQVDALSKLIEVIVGLKITGSATEMPMPLENDVFSRCSSHATRCQYHCRWPKTASWTFEASRFFFPPLPVTKEPHFRLSGQTLNPYSSSQKRNWREHIPRQEIIESVRVYHLIAEDLYSLPTRYNSDSSHREKNQQWNWRGQFQW